MPIQAAFRRVGKVGAELDEERAEVLVENVEVVVVGHRGRADTPRVRLPGRVAPFLRAEDARLLLRFPDEQHALLTLERRQILLRDVVLPLALLERDQVHPFGRGDSVDGLHECLTHGSDHHGRRHSGPQLRLHEVDKAAARLQGRDVRIDAIDRFQLERHVVFEDLSNVFAYHGGGTPASAAQVATDPTGSIA